MRRGMLIGTAIAASLALTACGSGETGGGGETGATTLSMVDNAFEPADFSADAGTQLEVTNDGEAPHNITIEGTGIDEDVEAGASTTVSMDLDPGSYTMFCEFHRGAGMEGIVTIG